MSRIKIEIKNRTGRKVSVRSPFFPGGKAVIAHNEIFLSEMDKEEGGKVAASIRNIPGIETKLSDIDSGYIPAQSPAVPNPAPSAYEEDDA